MTATLRYTIFIIFVGVVFYGVFNDTAIRVLGLSDKTAHMLAFAVLSLSGLMVLPKHFLGCFFVLTIVLAVGSEFIQGWLLPHRSFATMDILANLSGVVAVVCLWLLGVLVKRRKV